MGVGDTVHINGGEPLVYGKICELIDFLYDNGMKISLITNGKLLDTIPQHTLEKLTTLIISLHSNDKSLYDKIRLDDSFEMVMGNILNVQNYDIEDKSLLYIINSMTIDKLNEFSRFSYEIGYKPCFSIQTDMFSGSSCPKYLFNIEPFHFKECLLSLREVDPRLMTEEYSNYIIDYFDMMRKGMVDSLFNKPLCYPYMMNLSDSGQLSCLTRKINSFSVDDFVERVSRCKRVCGINTCMCRLNTNR